MPISKSRRKGKSRSKRKTLSSSNGTPIVQQSSGTRAQALAARVIAPIDDPWFTFVIFLSLVTGGVAAGGLVPPDFLNFSMILGSLMASRYLGKLLAIKSSTLSLRTVSSSIESLKTGKRASHTASQIATQGELIEICLIFVLIAAFLSLFLGVTEKLDGTTLLLGSSASLVYLRARIPCDVLSLVVSACVVLLLPCWLAVLGIFCQTGTVLNAGTLLGLVPGSMLGASVVARYARQLEEQGWKRSRLILSRKGKEVLRPGGVAQLYTGFLLSGFFLVFILASTGTLPQPMMIVVLIMFIAPKVAASFLERTVPDEQIFQSTVRLAVGAGLLTLAAAALARL